MNKKFSTLVVAALLTTSMNGFAQVKIDATTTSGNAKYTVLPAANAAQALFDRFVLDQSSSRTNSVFPTVSPFNLSTAYGAKPISVLNRTDGQADGRYFQFAASANEVLTMVWVKNEGYVEADKNYKDADKTIEGLNPTTDAGHFEVQIENINNANVPNNRITLDRTLWKVTAHKDAAGTVLYYELQNKSTEAILQLSTENVIPNTTSTNGATEVSLKIVNGQTNWRWSDGATASIASTIEAAAGNVLKNSLRAQYTNGMTIHLARKVLTDTDGSTKHVSLGAVMLNSNKPFAIAGDAVTVTYAKPDGAVNAPVATFYPLTFESWEANPIILTADQINAELGNEALLTEDKKTKDAFHFEFAPDVQGDQNVMLASNYQAMAPVAGYDRLPGDAPDGFVRFLKKGTTNEYLRVDTAYYDASLNGGYNLKMTVGQILYPRYAVAQDGATVDSNGNLVKGGVLTADKIYGNVQGAVASSVPFTAKSFVQLKRQSNFRPIFYPSTQSLRLQAEMMHKAGKADLQGTPWWLQMAQDASATASTSAATAFPASSVVGTNNVMRFAMCAEAPGTATSGVNVARGYYPSYMQTITYTAGAAAIAQGLRAIHYKSAWGTTNLTVAKERNGYAPHGASDLVATVSTSLWNAVGNLYQADKAATEAAVGVTPTNLFVFDPAATPNAGDLATPAAALNEITAAVTTAPVIYAPHYALANSNLVRLVTLTQNHVVLTAAEHDLQDTKYNGLLTYITLKTTKTESGLDEVAEIPEGFYYIQNANEKNSDLTKVGDYRYEDLASTNAMFTYWNADTQRWDRGVAALDGNGAKNGASNAAATTKAMAEAKHTKDNANIGNLVYSTDKKVIPSAQWYVKGNGGYYTIINRESGRTWGTSYWWKTSQPNVYVNLATYTDGTGLQQSYRDTIRIESIPTAELTNKYMGYLHMTQEVAKADTSVYSVGMTSMGDERFSLTDVNGVLKMVKDAKGEYKLERALVYDKDIYSQAEQKTDSLYYGFAPSVNGQADSTKMLMRAKYFIYKDEVSANSGIEGTSIMARKYITLESGQYRLQEVKVQKVNGDESFTTNVETDEKANTDGVKVRRGFYVKQISTEDPTQFVLVDPLVVTQTGNGVATQIGYGARLFANQLTSEVQPGGLVSNGFANSYASSILNIEKKQAYNYRDIRPEGVARDTVEFFSAKTDGQYLLSENTVKGANVGLLESLDKRLNKNNAIFLDTANVNYSECPRFLLGVRSKDSVEVSNLDNHNHHLFTDADYLVNMVDSAANNSVYVYKNQDFNQTKYYRLGFIRARHQGNTLTFEKSGKVYKLDNNTLGEKGLNIATYAFRYANTDRNEFYIETKYDHNTTGWLKTINHVLVVTPNIQEAEVFSFKKSEQAPTSNDQITTSAVSVIAGNGVVTVKNAAGKNVVVNNILGQTIASTVLTSDDATITVPAGIVVVAVDGEEAVKTVVK